MARRTSDAPSRRTSIFMFEPHLEKINWLGRRLDMNNADIIRFALDRFLNRPQEAVVADLQEFLSRHPTIYRENNKGRTEEPTT